MTMIEGWKIKRLDQIGDICSGSTPLTAKPEFWDGEIVWITPNDLSKLRTPYLSTTAKKVTPRGLKNCSAQLLPAYSVTISSRAPIGYVALPVVEFCTNQGCKSIRLKPEFSPEFVYYNILFHVEKLKNLGEGTTFAEISKTTLSTVEMPFPEEKEEQTQIATILSTLDQAIEQTEAIIAKQQRSKAGLMQDLLTKGIDEYGVIRSEATHEFKDSPLGWIPVEWEVKNLDSCVRPDSPICYGILMPGSGFDNGVLVIKVKDIFDGRICEKDILLTDPKIDQAYKRSRLVEGDLLMTIRGTTGRIAIVPKTLDGANITQDTARIRIRPEHSNRFFYFLLHSRKVQDQVMLHTLGQAVKGINIAEVRRISFALPAKTEQERISNTLTHANNLWEAALDCRSKLLQQKTGLLHDLLTGKVRVKTTPLPLRGEEAISR